MLSDVWFILYVFCFYFSEQRVVGKVFYLAALRIEKIAMSN